MATDQHRHVSIYAPTTHHDTGTFHKLWRGSAVALLVLGCGQVELEKELEIDQVQSAVVNGSTVSASVLRDRFSNSIVQLFDGGSGSGLLIAPRLVLTAGHCGHNCSWDTPTSSATIRIGADSDNPIEEIPVVAQWDITGDPDTSWAHDAGWPVDGLVGVSCSTFGHTDLGLWELAYPPRKAVPYWDEEQVREAFAQIEIGDSSSIYGFGEGMEDHDGLLQSGRGEVSQAPEWERNDASGKFGVRMHLTFENGQRAEGGDSGGPIFNALRIPVGVIANANHQWVSGPSTGAHLSWIQGMVERLDEELLTGDFDGNGYDDVLHTNRNNEGDWVDIYVGRERPTRPVVPNQLMTFCGDSNLSIGDVNGDGKDDLACPRTTAGIDGAPSSETITVFLAQVNPLGDFIGFDMDNARVYPLPEKCGRAFLGHFDGVSADGKRRADLLCRSSALPLSSKLQLYKNTGDMKQPYGSRPNWSSTDGWCRFDAMHVADLDGDRRDDLLCDKSRSGSIEVRYSLSSATIGFEAKKSVTTDWCKTGKLMTGHLDLDMASDLVCWKSGIEPFYRLSSRSRSSVPYNFRTPIFSRFDDSGFCTKQTQSISLLDLSNVSRRTSLVCYDHENGQTTDASVHYDSKKKLVSFDLHGATKMPALDEKL